MIWIFHVVWFRLWGIRCWIYFPLMRIPMTWRWRMIRLTRVMMLGRGVVRPFMISFFGTTKFWSETITVIHMLSIVWFRMVSVARFCLMSIVRLRIMSVIWFYMMAKVGFWMMPIAWFSM